MLGGRVTEAGYSGIGGNNVVIEGDDGLTYYYAHMQGAPAVQVGQTVPSGVQIGAVGRTGNAANTPAHLHFGVGKGIIDGGGSTGGPDVTSTARHC
jgi:murein DD-endopeptidase MepM/ murein hydrolase activator NlpD